MKQKVLIAMLSGAIILMGVAATAQQKIYVYPEKGQTYEQQEQDKFQCHNWAVEQSGIDPYDGNYPRAGGEVIKGAVTGAAVGAASGAAIGAIAGDAGKGAAIGATAGGCTGSMHGAQRATRVKQEYRGEYNRAFASCMEGRGYSVR